MSATDKTCSASRPFPTFRGIFVSTFFASDDSVSAYYGLVPRRGHSGKKNKHNDSITKAWDSLVRLMLVEAVSGNMAAAKTNTKKRARGATVSAEVEQEARKCNTRNRRNRRRLAELTEKGKVANVAKTAVASELTRDMWVIGRMVQAELAGGGGPAALRYPARCLFEEGAVSDRAQGG